MADFNAAFARLMVLEGYPGYVNNPRDRGGETIAGISRRHWPGWPGWHLVDSLRESAKPDRLATSEPLRETIKSFYRRNFWTPLLAETDHQRLAEWLFHMGVNIGWRQAVKLLQRALGIDDDGLVGQQTRSALAAADPDALLERCRTQAVAHYRAIVAHDHTQEIFLTGWINRANA